MNRASIHVLAVLALLAMLVVAACSTLFGPPYQAPIAQPNSSSQTPFAPSRALPPTASAEAPPPASAIPQPAPLPPHPPPREFHLGTAAAALVAQAQRDAASGSPQLAEATIERALRIEPENPLLWIMLGQNHESAGQYVLAGSMGHKALQLATGDPRAQSSAWRLIGDSLRARGMNVEANDAYTHAENLTSQ